MVWTALLGAAAGSFMNVCISRLPSGESVVAPRSRCPACGSAIRWFENIPLVSWAILRARCRCCAAPISWRYPAIEGAGIAIWAGMGWAFGMSAHALAGAVLFTLLLGIAVIDYRHYLIPLPLALGGLAAGIATSLLPGPPRPLASALGAAVGYSTLFVTGWLGERALKKPAMGGGDMWMMAMVGAFLGPGGALLTIFLGALSGAVVFGPVALRTGKLVPFGAFLAIGAAITFLFGDSLVGWHLRLIGSG